MTGTITKRPTKNGRPSWAYVFDAGTKADGSRRQITKSGFETKREAQDALRVAITIYTGAGIVQAPRTGRTLREFFGMWLKDYAAPRCEQTTFERYEELAEYLLKRIGHLDIDKLGPKLIEDTLNNLQKCGGRITSGYPDGRPLSPKTIDHIKSCLHTALKTAVRWGMLERSPMEHGAVQMPPLQKKEQAALDGPSMDKMLVAAEGTRLYPFLVLAFSSGCRRGELLALQWSDIDLETGRLNIAKSLEQTKTYGTRVKDRTKGK
jgi:integrase